MRAPTNEELEYVKAMVTQKRPLCWWCWNRPGVRPANTCTANIDWRETAAMERKQCKRFHMDITRIGNTEEPEARHQTQTREQLNIDFSGGEA